MLLLDILISGLMLGGMYALIAMGLTLQYGVARILNLAYGEFLVGAAFAAFLLYTDAWHQPAARACVAVPLAFVANWLIYRWLLTPLVNRAQEPRAAGGRQHPRDLRAAVRRAGHRSRRLRRPVLQLRLSFRPGHVLGSHAGAQSADRRWLRRADRRSASILR